MSSSGVPQGGQRGELHREGRDEVVVARLNFAAFAQSLLRLEMQDCIRLCVVGTARSIDVG